MKKFLLVTSILISVAIISASFNVKPTYKFHHNSRSAGAAAIFDAGYTGATFDNFGNSCDNCHGGGNFTPTLTVQLLNNSGNPVTTYSTGQNYTLRLTINTQNSPVAYGFQTMAVRQSDEANINTWGTPPANTHNTLTSSGRNYIEHGTQLLTNVINIPWTGPISTTGTVSFYAIANAVDYDLSSSGDEPSATTILNVTYAAPACNTNTWNGNVSTAWETAGNWSCGSVPTAITDVIIPAGKTVVVNSNRSCRSLNVSPSASVTVNTGFILTITN